MTDKLKFTSSFVDSLPADPELQNFPRQVSNACFSRVQPTLVADPKLISVSHSVLQSLGLTKKDIHADWFKQVFSGNQLLDGMKPFAMCYGGHQFGQWAGQLGDGRAINLGEIEDVDGVSQTLQLKGAGLTPYSRTADGLAVLRSSVREFLCSEAMHYLGVSTTRALSLCLTGEQVMRDMFYDGNPQLEQGAVVCRVAPTFIRFGSFQILSARNEFNHLKTLADFTIQQSFSHLLDLDLNPNEIYEHWFEEICQKTLQMIIDWTRVGFVHGVMNTDNMSITGLTIDYGPYGWLEGYDLKWTPNTTDEEGRRYAFGNQAVVAQWNLFQLANAIFPLINRAEKLEASLQKFSDEYKNKYRTMYLQKLGIQPDENSNDSNDQFIGELLNCLSLVETDMTIFFRLLTNIEPNENLEKIFLIIKPAFYSFNDLTQIHKKQWLDWLGTYVKKISQQETLFEKNERIESMNQVNPKYILRNYLVQQAIDKAEKGDYSEIENLLKLIEKPYDEQPEFEHYFQKRPEWARNKAGCSMLSCSS